MDQAMAAEAAPTLEKHTQDVELDHVDRPDPSTQLDSKESHVETTDVEISDQSPAAGADTEGTELQGVRLMLLLSCLFTGCFLSGYDSSAVATLIPVISDEFHGLRDIGWYSTSYLLGICAPMLIYGQLYSINSTKKLYISALCIFMIGSIITTASPSSSVFIFGRALTGLGAAGLDSGGNIILAQSTPLSRRPTYFALEGGMECAAIAFGPLIAGAIARYVTWRVCFAITIPLALIIGVLMIFVVPELRRQEQVGWKEQLRKIDFIGLVFQVPATVCLILALQWAGIQYSWANFRIILLLVLAGVLAVAFFFSQHKIGGEKAMLPLRILRQRTVASACLVVFCNFSALWVVSFYLPVYFQAVRNATTLGSGLMILPLALSQVVAALISGPITTKLGYCNPNVIVGTALSVIGSGLLTILRPDSSAVRWILFQIVYGVGIGMAFQPPFIAVQAVLEGASIPLGLVLVGFTQIFGGIVALSMAQNVFLNKLAHNLAVSVPLNPDAILNHGALGLINVVPARYRTQVLLAYNEAIVDVLYIPLAFTCLAFLFSFGFEWKSVKDDAENEET